MRRVQDKFRDWNLYHKGVAVAIGTMVFWVLVWSVFVYDRAFEVVDEAIIDAGASDIWPYIVENQKRDDWTAELLRVQGVSYEVGRNRFLYWKRRYDQWRSYEVTTGLVQNRLFHTEQDSDEDKRWWQVELEPLGECKTKVTLREVIMPTKYSDRFWFFRVREERELRLAYSLEALNRHAAKAGTSCKTDEG